MTHDQMKRDAKVGFVYNIHWLTHLLLDVFHKIWSGSCPPLKGRVRNWILTTIPWLPLLLFKSLITVVSFQKMK